MTKPSSKKANPNTKRTKPSGKTVKPKADLHFRPLVFISHDSRDAELAEAFANLLIDASGGFINSFRSSDRKGTAGIEFGDEWYNTVMTNLDVATDVVALLTAQSIDRPWILYEVGVGKGKLDKQVFGVALGIPLNRAIQGPFAQFQNCGDDEDSLTKLVLQLIKRNSDAEPREEAVRRQVNAFRENIKPIVKSKAKNSQATLVDPNQVSKLFEEIKVSLRDIPQKVNKKLKEDSVNPGSQRRRSISFSLLERLISEALKGSQRERATNWLMFISLLRDEFPWLYEVGLDVYRAFRSHNAAQVNSSIKRFIRTLNYVNENPIFEEVINMEDSYVSTLLHELPHMMSYYMDQMAFDNKLQRPKQSRFKLESEDEET